MNLKTEPIFQMKMLSERISKCSKCILSLTRTHVVPGSGSVQSQIFFIGEAPGLQEDLQGLPFVGRAGKLFDKLLSSINLNRNEIFITNILKCRPPNNRNPHASEIHHCTPYLDKQISIIKPKILVPMGNFATKYCCQKYNLHIQNISAIHGKRFSISHEFFSGKLMPLYHPAAAIYNPNLEQYLVKDMKYLKSYLSEVH